MGRWTLAHTEDQCSDKFHRALQNSLKSSGMKLEEFCEGFDPQDQLIQKLVGAIVQDVARRRSESKQQKVLPIQERLADASHYITTSLYDGTHPYPRPRRTHHRVRRRQEVIWPNLDHQVESTWQTDFPSSSIGSNTEGSGDMADIMPSGSSTNLYEAYADRLSGRDNMVHSRSGFDASWAGENLWGPGSSQADEWPVINMPLAQGGYVQAPRSPEPSSDADFTSILRNQTTGNSGLRRQSSIRRNRIEAALLSSGRTRRETSGGTVLDNWAIRSSQASPVNEVGGTLAGGSSSSQTTTPVTATNPAGYPRILPPPPPESRRRPPTSPNLEHPVSSMRSSFAHPENIISQYLSPHPPAVTHHPMDVYDTSLPPPQIFGSGRYRSPSPMAHAATEWELEQDRLAWPPL